MQKRCHYRLRICVLIRVVRIAITGIAGQVTPVLSKQAFARPRDQASDRMDASEGGCPAAESDGDGQGEAEGGSLAQDAAGADVAAMGFHQLFDNGETQAITFA